MRTMLSMIAAYCFIFAALLEYHDVRWSRAVSYAGLMWLALALMSK